MQNTVAVANGEDPSQRHLAVGGDDDQEEGTPGVMQTTTETMAAARRMVDLTATGMADLTAGTAVLTRAGLMRGVVTKGFVGTGSQADHAALHRSLPVLQ